MLIFIFGNYPLILVFISGHSYMSISAAFLAIVTSSLNLITLVLTVVFIFSIINCNFDVFLQQFFIDICIYHLVMPTDLNYWIKHPFEFSDPILKPEYL